MRLEVATLALSVLACGTERGPVLADGAAADTAPADADAHADARIDGRIPPDARAPQLLATLSSYANGLVADGDVLYVAVADGLCPHDDVCPMPEPVIARVDGAGSVTTLAEGGFGAAALALDATHVYYLAPSSTLALLDLRRVPRSGGAPELLLADATTIGLLAVGDGEVYWMRDGIQVASLDGSSRRSFAAGVVAHGLALSPGHIYVTKRAPNGRVMRFARSGGDAEVLVADTAPVGPLLLTANDLYYLFYGPSGFGGVVRVPLDGSPSFDVATGKPQPYFFGVDDTWAYWTSGPSRPYVMRASLQGGPPAIFADGGEPQHLAVAETFVAWSSWADLLRVAK